MKNRRRRTALVVVMIVAAYGATWASARRVLDPAIREALVKDVESNGIERVPNDARAGFHDRMTTLINSAEFDLRVEWVAPILPGVVVASSDWLVKYRADSKWGFGCRTVTACFAYGVSAKCFFTHTSGCAP